MQDALIGTKIGSFEIREVLGKGSMGVVYLASQPEIGSRVAIKLLHPEYENDPSVLARFRAEAKAVNLIGSEHVVGIVDYSVTPRGQHYLVMEYLAGRSLTELHKPLDQPLLVHVLGQLCDALGAAHRAGVVHRDLKPENVRLVKRAHDANFVKLFDFSVAKLLADGSPELQTRQGQLLGTPEFMAPEQTTGEPVDGRADLYALGVLAFELAVGRLPFTASTVMQVLLAQRSSPPLVPHKLNPSLPFHLSQAILKALEKDRERRWQSAEEFKAALEAPRVHLVVYDSRGEGRALFGASLSPRGVFVISEVLAPLGTPLRIAVTLGGQELRARAHVVGYDAPPGVQGSGFEVAFDEALSPA